MALKNSPICIVAPPPIMHEKVTFLVLKKLSDIGEGGRVASAAF